MVVDVPELVFHCGMVMVIKARSDVDGLFGGGEFGVVV